MWSPVADRGSHPTQADGQLGRAPRRAEARLARKARQSIATEAERQGLKLLGGAFSACAVVLSARGALPLYVANQRRTYAYQIRPEVVASGCCCWSPFEAVRATRFITKPALMLHKSREVKLDGPPIYIKLADAKQAFKLRPTSKSRLEAIFKDVIAWAIREGIVPTKDEYLAMVKNYADVFGVSDREIERIAASLKPTKWSEPGPRRRSS